MPKRALRSLLVVAVLALLSLASTGCVGFRVDTTVNADGSGVRAIETVLDKTLTDLVRMKGDTSAKEFEKQLRENLPPNATLRTFTKQGQLHYVARFSFSSVGELNRITRARSLRTGPGATRASLRVTPRLLDTTYAFEETLPPLNQPLTAEETKLLRQFEVTYRLTLPGAITSCNADKTVDGAIAVWSVPLLKGRSIRATSRTFNVAAIAGVTVASLIALIAAIAVFALLLRRRQAGVEPAESEQ